MSDKVMRSLLRGEPIPHESLQTQVDFKLLQLGWVYDINYPWSMNEIRKRRYLETIKNALPDLPGIDEVFDKVRGFRDSAFAAATPAD